MRGPTECRISRTRARSTRPPAVPRRALRIPPAELELRLIHSGTGRTGKRDARCHGLRYGLAGTQQPVLRDSSFWVQWANVGLEVVY